MNQPRLPISPSAADLVSRELVAATFAKFSPFERTSTRLSAFAASVELRRICFTKTESGIWAVSSTLAAKNRVLEYLGSTLVVGTYESVDVRVDSCKFTILVPAVRI